MVSTINEKKGAKLDRPYLRELRKSLRLRQSDMAAALDISLQHYKNIESGFSDPSYEVLDRFSKAFPKVINVWLTFQKVEKSPDKETEINVKREYISIETIDVKTDWGKK